MLGDTSTCLTCGAPLAVVNQTIRNVGTERFAILTCTAHASHKWEATTLLRPFNHVMGPA